MDSRHKKIKIKIFFNYFMSCGGIFMVLRQFKRRYTDSLPREMRPRPVTGAY